MAFVAGGAADTQIHMARENFKSGVDSGDLGCTILRQHGSCDKRVECCNGGMTQ